MAVGPATPVSAIEGIGPATERLLQDRGLFAVFDLLRASAPAIHEVVAGVASLDQVRSWRQMATLLQVHAVTPQWAEALVKANVATFEDLARMDLSELSAVFETAVDEHTIPAPPTADQIAVMLKDASALRFAGAITGTLRDRDGKPVAGAAVSAAGVESESDERGRFRLLRLPMGTVVQLTARKDGLRSLVLEVRPVPTRAVSVLQLRMLPDAAPAGRPASAALDELNGDALLPMTGQPVTSHEVPAGELRRGDLLRLTMRYADGKDVKLVSKLLEYADGSFRVHWVRVRASDLPGGAEVDDHFLRTATGFQKVRMDGAKLLDYKRLLRARRAGPAGPLPETARERDDAARRFFEVLNGTGL